MRLIEEIPEAAEILIQGRVPLDAMGALQTHARREKLNIHQKRELLNEIEDKSSREIKMILTGDDRIALKISPELHEKLRQLQMELGFLNLDTLIEKLADEKLTQLRRSTPVPESKQTKSSETRYIPRTAAREVAQRDQLRCTYTDPATDRRCPAENTVACGIWQANLFA